MPLTFDNLFRRAPACSIESTSVEPSVPTGLVTAVAYKPGEPWIALDGFTAFDQRPEVGSDRPEQPSRAVVLNGTTQYGELASNPYSGTGVICNAFWFKTTDTGARTVVGLGTVTENNRWQVNVENGVIWERSVNSRIISWGSGFNDGAWHHCVIQKPLDGLLSDITCYVDGQLLSIASIGIDDQIDIVNGAIPTQIGAHGGGSLWAGHLSMVQFFGDLLTPAEIAAIYAQGKDPRNIVPGQPTDALVTIGCADNSTVTGRNSGSLGSAADVTWIGGGPSMLCQGMDVPFNRANLSGFTAMVSLSSGVYTDVYAKPFNAASMTNGTIEITVRMRQTTFVLLGTAGAANYMGIRAASEQGQALWISGFTYTDIYLDGVLDANTSSINFANELNDGQFHTIRIVGATCSFPDVVYLGSNNTSGYAADYLGTTIDYDSDGNVDIEFPPLEAPSSLLVIVPLQDANQALDTFGNAAQNTGQAPRTMRLDDSPCGTLPGFSALLETDTTFDLIATDTWEMRQIINEVGGGDTWHGLMMIGPYNYNAGVMINRNDLYLRFYTEAGNSQSADDVIVIGQTHDVRYGYDGADYWATVDGVEVIRLTGIGTVVTNKLRFGNGLSSWSMKGRAWNLQYYVNGILVVGCPLSEKFGNIAHDTSGNGNDMVGSGLNQTTFWAGVQSDYHRHVLGGQGTVGVFDDNNITIPNVFPASYTGDFEFEVRLFLTAASVYPVILVGTGFILRLHSNKRQVRFDYGGIVLYSAVNSIPLSTWTRIKLKVNTTTNLVEIYLNGVVVSSTTSVSSPVITTSSLATTGSSSGSAFWPGLLCDFVIRAGSTVVAKYNLDGNTLDTSGNNNHGTNNGVTFGEIPAADDGSSLVGRSAPSHPAGVGLNTLNTALVPITEPDASWHRGLTIPATYYKNDGPSGDFGVTVTDPLDSEFNIEEPA